MGDINFQKAIDDYIQSGITPSWYGYNTFRASGLTGCVRQSLLLRLGIRTPGGESLRQMQIGTIIHRFMQQHVALGSIGRPVELEKKIEVTLADVTITGHIDCWDGETVYDFKTTANIENTLKYPMAKAYTYQLSVYAFAMETKKAVVVYIDKRNLKVAQKDVAIIPAGSIMEFCHVITAAEDRYRETEELPSKDDCYSCRTEVST